MNMSCAPLLPLLLAALSFEAAATGLMSLEWTADGSFAKEVVVPAGQFAEACGKLPAGTRVAWRFEADTLLDFNIHFHEGEKITFPARQNGAAKADGTLDAASAQHYCWMWTNQ